MRNIRQPEPRKAELKRSSFSFCISFGVSTDPDSIELGRCEEGGTPDRQMEPLRDFAKKTL